MRAVVGLIALTLAACSSGSAPPSGGTAVQRSTQPQVQSLRVFAAQRKLTIQMMPNDRVLDGIGATIGKFDAKTGVVVVGGVAIPLDSVIHAQADRHVELSLPAGTWQIDVATSGEITVDGEYWGHVEGFDGTPQAWRRLQALFAALPLMPAVRAP